MIKVRKSSERGHFNHGWLDTFHTFSFASYYDPVFVGFGPLRVINEDRVEGGMGFGTHPHRDMEIISYVLKGALAHKDSTGGGSTLHYGDVQRMTAGSGVAHSEFNPSETEEAHFLQIWLHPSANGLRPSYEEKHFDRNSKLHTLRLIASPDAADGSLFIHQDARVYASILSPGDSLEASLPVGRKAWLQVAKGAITLNNVPLSAGDGAAIEGEDRLTFTAGSAEAEILYFDLPTV